MAPRTFARLIQAATIEQTDNVLIIGALSGYSAAVLSGMARAVVALESDAAMTDAAKTVLTERGCANVTCVTSPLEAGWAAAAPYDVIVIEGGIETIAEALKAQLAGNGRLVAIENAGGVGRAVVLQKAGPKGQETLSRRVVFEAAAACLPGFARTKAFAF